MYSTLIRNFAVPLYDLARRTSRYKYGRILNKTQYLSEEEINLLQSKNLRALINHAYRTVPYYHRILKERGLRPNDIRNTQDLKKLPILKKVDIRSNFADLISKANSKKLVPYETGGTGSPLKFYITREQMSWEIAAEFRAYRWAEYNLGDRCFMLWGSHRDLKANIPNRVAALLQRTLVVDPFVLSNQVLRTFARLLERFKPKVIRGYSAPVYIMAKFLLENGIDSIRPRSVITSAEKLFGFMRKTIEEAFDCQVFDFYGSREAGAIASECEEHNGYHISAENVAVEFVKNNEPVSPREDGMILLTGLRNYGMPLIRYENGDVGRPSDEEKCNCRRGLPLMKSLKGRTIQFLAVRDESSGEIVPVSEDLIEFLVFSMKSTPEQFRVIQEDLDHVTIKILQKDPSPRGKDIDSLIRQVQEYIGKNTKIEVQLVAELPPLPSGKRSIIISKVNPFECANSD